jgi:predicted NAD/FAD-dependent oxidoreductase
VVEFHGWSGEEGAGVTNRRSSPPRQTNLDGTLGTRWSAEHIDDPPEHVLPALTREFSRLLSGEVTDPTHTAAHLWRYALPPEPLQAGALWDAAARLAMCGDWCQSSRIEGAFLGGLAAAGRLLSVTIASTGV